MIVATKGSSECPGSGSNRHSGGRAEVALFHRGQPGAVARWGIISFSSVDIKKSNEEEKIEHGSVYPREETFKCICARLDFACGRCEDACATR